MRYTHSLFILEIKQTEQLHTYIDINEHYRMNQIIIIIYVIYMHALLWIFFDFYIAISVYYRSSK